jgi:hypothetical protein
MLYALLGAGCQTLCNLSTEQGEVAMGRWPSDHVGVVRGLRAGQGGFGFTAHYEKGHFSAVIEGADFYREMLKVIVGMFETKTLPIDLAETREIMAFIEAAARSAANGGASVSLD